MMESAAALVGNLPLRDVMDLLAGTFYVLDESGHFVLWNRQLEQVTGLSPERLRTVHMLELFDPDMRARVAKAFCTVFQSNERVQIEARVRNATGGTTPFLFVGSRLSIVGDGSYMCGMGVDLTRHYRQRDKLELFERALMAASNGIVITRHEGRDNPIEYVNPAFERISGYAAVESINHDSRFMAARGMDDDQRTYLANAIAEHRAATVVFRNQRKNGELFWNHLTVTPVRDQAGHVTHFIGIIEDITALKQRTAQLEHLVTHDPLTGLANRLLLRDRLEHAVQAAQRDNDKVAVILMDLNKFKEINDTMGHSAGDTVLKHVAQRLQSALRESDTVARLGGDEFVMVLAAQPSLRYTLKMIERIRRAMAPEMEIDGRWLSVGASMGVAVWPDDGRTPGDLLHAADTAMYEGKNGGPDAVHFYSPGMADNSAARQRMEAALRDALERDDLYLLFQPHVAVDTGKILGVEALLRWRHPERGELLPADFLPDAEESGLIVPLGRRVLEEVCSMLRRLAELGFPDLPISVNASSREFSQRDYLPHIAKRIAHHGVNPASLTLEMREEQLMHNPEQATRLANGLQELGISLSVDEFGAGMNNLSCLRQLQVSQLKMTRQRVQEIDAMPGSGALVKTMLDIGNNLNIRVVATGVETRDQHDFLAANGCTSVQGNYISQPMTRPALEEWLAAH
ncbi:putative bifunctional diguanylate cyclase/phosphodiesterase [Pseudoduganella umbonata]|uniref:Diguanylate cyclase (GGDEF)-like protein/PAS domain S-box-containing protein n=1 Tax=Pseudoduganella umbonata TaxID=864828 RepID=A0A4P8HPX7_9BURK|nr:EAL domain-containing protein [Pseudoduganella umbonata]MBB3224875.1 diguanylate cyclase (GGDEF)-like protein/PAS domain S-box-containing protein [Pseudoduganella umbonata]QCP11176.1 EAL domain-containing protein [Pseudoduganella umbonata]